MARRVFRTDLSQKGIENLKRQILSYKNNELPMKCQMLTQVLASKGFTVASAKINESPLARYVTLKIESERTLIGAKSMLIGIGESIESDGYEPFNTMLAIEFGAGIHYNSEENPRARELGFGVGSFPGQTHAFDDGWYFWDDKNQQWKFSRGIKATMPLYSADLEIINSVLWSVKEVFG